MDITVKKFVAKSTLAVAALLAALLAVINITSFAMAADDADRLTQMIADGNGRIGDAAPPAGGGGFGRMGPGSPELAGSTRYFAYSVGDGRMEAFRISAFSEEEAAELAVRLSGGTCGWTKGIYRYRVSRERGRTLVIVVDQGRELLTAYRILIISVIGGALCLAAGFAVILSAGKKLFHTFRENDRQHKRFIAAIRDGLDSPLGEITAETDAIERESGANGHTVSIRRQIKKISELAAGTGQLSVFGGEERRYDRIDLSALLAEKTAARAGDFSAKGIELSVDAGEGIAVSGPAGDVAGAVEELVENAVRFSEGFASFSLTERNGQVTLTAESGTSLPEGAVNSAFDRYVRLENAAGTEGGGLGLAFVRDTVSEMNGRASAAVKNGRFTVTLVF